MATAPCRWLRTWESTCPSGRRAKPCEQAGFAIVRRNRRSKQPTLRPGRLSQASCGNVIVPRGLCFKPGRCCRKKTGDPIFSRITAIAINGSGSTTIIKQIANKKSKMRFQVYLSCEPSALASGQLQDQNFNNFRDFCSADAAVVSQLLSSQLRFYLAASGTGVELAQRVLGLSI